MLFISAIYLILFMIIPASAGVIPDDVGPSCSFFLNVANDGGASADLYADGTYAMYFHGGGYGVTFKTDDTFDSSDTTGENLFLNTSDGSFYLNFYGGRGGLQRVILMLAVNGTIPDNFSAHFKTSGYKLNYSETLAERLTSLTEDDISYESTGIDESFSKDDFKYGPQLTRPPSTTAIYHSQNTSDVYDTYQVMFIDTGLGVIGNREGAHGSVVNENLTHTGKLKVDYSFENLGDCMAVINAYGWLYSGTNSSDDLDPSISWTNLGSTDGEVRVLIDNSVPEELPVVSFNADVTYGEVPLSVQFNDTSTGNPSSWLWDFGDGENSTSQNPSHIYDTAGTYTVNFTAANSAGSNTTVSPDLISVTIAGGSLPADSAWPKFGYDSQNTGRSVYDGPQVYTEKWTTKIGVVQYSSPAIDSEGTIYVGSTDKHLYAVYPNGTNKWNYSAPYYVGNTPALSADGTIYFGSGAYLVALSSDGTEKWILEDGGYTYCSPAIGSDGIIYTGSSTYGINAVYPNGTLKWSYTTGGNLNYNCPAFGSDGTIYLTSDDGNLYALNPEGTLKWEYQTGSSHIRSSPVIGADGTIYIECYDGYVYAISSGGALKWKYKAGSSSLSYGSPVIGPDGTIYVAEYSGGGLHALNPDGTLKWAVSIEDSSVRCSPVIGADGTIYINGYTSSTSGHIYAINPDGSTKWSQSIATRFWSSAVIGPDGTLYLGSYSGYLYAFEKVVDFTTDKTSGESPLTVQFTGTSDRNVSSWSWDFGDGTNSTMQNPSHEYSSDGSYAVSLTITDQDSGETFSVEKPGFINTYTPPAASFGVDIYSGQVPMTVNFTDMSANNPTAWLWNFGDGNTSAEQNPTYMYTSGGTYSVTLYVENPAGNDTYTNSSCITAEAQPVPVVDFNSSVNEGQAPLEVTFTDLSTNAPFISRQWVFGDGSTSTSQNPAHTYKGSGNYTVELTVTNYGGTNSTTKTSFVNVSLQDPPAVSYTGTNITISGDSALNSVPVPLTIKFTQGTTGYNITSYLWDFGDGFNSTEENPVYTYDSTGNYTINLTALNDGGSDTETINLIVAGVVTPVVDFSANRTYGKYPLTVQFTDESLYDPTSWSWDFGDGTNSTEQNPVHIYTGTGTYNITLTAANSAGSNTTTKTDYVTSSTTNAQPLSNYRNINIHVANDEGVKYDEPDGITRYEGIGIPYNYVNNTYFVLFGQPGGGSNPMDISSVPNGNKGSDGQITESTNQSGEFWITFSGGQSYMHEGILMLAVNGSIPDDFSVHIRSSGYDFMPPIPGVGNNNSISTPVYTEGAVNQTFTVDDFIYGPQIWKPFGTADYPIYTGQDMSDTGNTFMLMFIDLDLGATKTGTDQGSIKVEYEFNNLTSFAVFNSYGWYRVSNHGTGIIMTNCGSYYAVIGIAAPPVAGFEVSNTTGDVMVPVQFTDTSTDIPTSWSWDFGDGTNSTEQNPTHTYDAAGNYTVTLTASNNKGSDSTSLEIVQVAGEPPVAGFSVDKTSGESPLKVNFTDESTNSPARWFWDFGDGTNSTEQNPAHWYAPGKYSVNLTVTNGGGAVSLLKEDYITVSANNASGRIANSDFETGDMTGWESGTYASVSVGKAHNGSYSAFFSKSGNNPYSNNYIAQNVDLTSVSSISFWGYQEEDYGTQYFMTYIDGTLVQTDTCANSWTRYTIPVSNYTGVHEIRIGFERNMMGINGYVDELSMFVEPTPPVAGFSATPVSGLVPLTVQFIDKSSNYPTSWSWDFDGDGNIDSTEQNPEFVFSSMGTYAVSLTAANDDGSDTLEKKNYITVKGVQNVTTNVSVRHNGTITDDGNGNKQYSINKSEAQVRGNNIVIDSDSCTITIKSNEIPTTNGDSLVSDVTGIELETDPVEAVLDELGNVSGSVNLELNDLPENSGLEVTLEKGESGNGTAFQIAASSEGLNISSVAYTMNIVKSNLTNGQEIKEARITMSVPESWVEANGGVDSIKIIRIAEDGKKEVLDTTHIGTSSGIMTFEGYSPNGLSMFGLAATTQQQSTTTPVSYSSGTFTASSSSGGGPSEIGIDSAENLKAGDVATLHFDETSIYEMDVYAKTDIQKLFVTVEAGNMPEGAEAPEGDVYEYIAAFLYDTTAENVSKSTIRFSVLSDWVDSRLSSPDLLSLYYYDEDKDEWTKLSTVFDSEKNGVCYYYADSASLGYLAIVAVPDLDQVKSSSLQSGVTGQPTLAEAEKNVATATTAATAKATPLFGSMIVFVAFGLICTIAIVNRGCRKNEKK